MKRIFASSLLAVTTTTLTFAAVPDAVGAAEPAGGCAEPVPVRSYNQDHLSYRLELDLTDCAWWDRRAIRLDAALQRVSAAGDGGGAGTLALCGVVTYTPESGDMSDDGDVPFEAAQADDIPQMRPGWCWVEVSIDHPPLDTAHYKGTITFPWQGGPRAVSFNAICQASTGCVDLPVDPTTVLAPAADLYDAISGDGRAG